MLRFVMYKKGVSPLIATILLIAFAVALGSVVMNWGLNLSIGKPTDKCTPVEIKVRSIDNAQVCYGGSGKNGYINFVIDNTGGIDVTGLGVWIVGEKGTRLFDLDNILIKRDSLYDKKDKEVTYDFFQYGRISQVQFIPKITTEKAIEICPKNSIKVEKIGICG